MFLDIFDSVLKLQVYLSLIGYFLGTIFVTLQEFDIFRHSKCTAMSFKLQSLSIRLEILISLNIF